MKFKGNQGAMLLLILIFLSSCSKEFNVMSQTAPQVENQEVSFDIFEETIEPVGARSFQTRADGSGASPLKKSHLYSELEVCLIPKGEENDSGYVVRQDSISDDFGKVKMSVPSGDYTLVAVASKTNLKQPGNIRILSTTEMRFPDNSITDMSYTSQAITVTKDKDKQTEEFAIKRGISCFVLKANDVVPDNAASEEITITGNCGHVFNPSTGFCKTNDTVKKTLTFNAKEHKLKGLWFNVYVLLGSDDETNINVTAVSKDKDGKEIKTCSFKNVHLLIGKKTTYTGPIFTYSDGIVFTINNSNLEESGYGQNF